ncbi:MAG TPA: hypothetical protein VN905_05540 [Candidatus Binatia bacterium]|nr:hypothetical protein [Candidatus Binatia bacterium]
MRRANSAPLVALALAVFVAGCTGGSNVPISGVAAAPTPVPSPTATVLKLSAFALGGEQNVVPPGTANLQFTPDIHMSFQRQSDGTYKLWASGGGAFGTFGFTTPDFLTLTSMKSAGGKPAGVLLPAGAGTTAADADYAGAGSVFPAANGTDLLMIYHAENHLFSGTDYLVIPFYATVVLARSSDGGLTWTKQGVIISGLDAQQATQAATGAGALTPTAIVSGGFIYVLYREIDLQSGIDGVAIARAPVSSDGAPGSWKKYFGGSFSTPGLGGVTTPLNIVLDPTNKDLRQPHVSFNTYLNTFLMTMVGNGGIYVLTSPDLINWSAGLLVLNAPVPDSTVNPPTTPFNWNPTIISPGQASDTASGQTGYLYYAKGTGANSFHYMYRRAFTITGS